VNVDKFRENIERAKEISGELKNLDDCIETVLHCTQVDIHKDDFTGNVYLKQNDLYSLFGFNQEENVKTFLNKICYDLGQARCKLIREIKRL